MTRLKWCWAPPSRGTPRRALGRFAKRTPAAKRFPVRGTWKGSNPLRRDVALALRSLLFVLLLPGTVAGYIPLRIVAGGDSGFGIVRSPSSFAAGCLIVLGVAILLRCVWDFFAVGRGTLAPLDPPKHLVVNGLYRFTRNPMYNG